MSEAPPIALSVGLVLGGVRVPENLERALEALPGLPLEPQVLCFRGVEVAASRDREVLDTGALQFVDWAQGGTRHVFTFSGTRRLRVGSGAPLISTERLALSVSPRLSPGACAGPAYPLFEMKAAIGSVGATLRSYGDFPPAPCGNPPDEDESRSGPSVITTHTPVNAEARPWRYSHPWAS